MSKAGKSSSNTTNNNLGNRYRNYFNIPFRRNHVHRVFSFSIIAENEDDYREQYLEIQNMMLRLRIQYLTRSIRTHFRNLNRNNPNYRVPNIISRQVRRRLNYEDSVNSGGGDTSTDSSSSSDSENENFHIVP